MQSPVYQKAVPEQYVGLVYLYYSGDLEYFVADLRNMPWLIGRDLYHGLFGLLISHWLKPLDDLDILDHVKTFLYELADQVKLTGSIHIKIWFKSRHITTGTFTVLSSAEEAHNRNSTFGYIVRIKDLKVHEAMYLLTAYMFCAMTEEEI